MIKETLTKNEMNNCKRILDDIYNKAISSKKLGTRGFNQVESWYSFIVNNTEIFGKESKRIGEYYFLPIVYDFMLFLNGDKDDCYVLEIPRSYNSSINKLKDPMLYLLQFINNKAANIVLHDVFTYKYHKFLNYGFIIHEHEDYLIDENTKEIEAYDKTLFWLTNDTDYDLEFNKLNSGIKFYLIDKLYEGFNSNLNDNNIDKNIYSSDGKLKQALEKLVIGSDAHLILPYYIVKAKTEAGKAFADIMENCIDIANGRDLNINEKLKLMIDKNIDSDIMNKMTLGELTVIVNNLMAHFSLNELQSAKIVNVVNAG